MILMMYSQTLCELCMTRESEGEEGVPATAPATKKRWPATPSFWLLWDPSHQFPSSPVSQGLTTRDNPPHQEIATMHLQEERDWRGVSDIRPGGCK